MSTRFVNPQPVPERVGWSYQGTMKQENGTPIPLTSFASLTITIYAVDAALTVIQASTSILNVDRGTVGALDGLLTVTFVPDDSAMVDATLDTEVHRALIEGVYSTTRKFAHEIEWTVRNLAKRV